MQNLACRDPLTSLLNRRAGEEALQGCHAAAQVSGQAYAVIMTDIDRFKRVNDVYGHAAGDRIIAAVAQQLSQSVRSTDALVRWGGEEFLIALPGLELPAALELAERIRLAVASCHDAEVGSVTLSLGVAAGQAASSAIDTVHRADHALYAAKEQGRNRVLADGAVPDGRPGTLAGPVGL
ncbi:GGDEF domain-containing protein [Serpentinimonas barnesii]|uniref:GGDEF domain-containing protein n=1 Tax=Serpentinimonas barnesii TaxID=1458427 RepID=UPI000A74AF6D|nr:GGDEF domain-containing protein [Serpentinimonas barnesii]